MMSISPEVYGAYLLYKQALRNQFEAYIYARTLRSGKTHGKRSASQLVRSRRRKAGR